MLPTPTANQYEQDNEKLLSRREREKARGRNGNGFGLTTANALALLPTPTGDDANNVTRDSGEYRSLSREVHRLLPTPQATDSEGSRIERTAWTTGDGKRPSGAKATLPLATAIELLGELTERQSRDGSASSGLHPDQLGLEGG